MDDLSNDDRLLAERILGLVEVAGDETDTSDMLTVEVVRLALRLSCDGIAGASTRARVEVIDAAEKART